MQEKDLKLKPTIVKLIRKDSQGLKGTYANIDHHAQKVKLLVQALEPYGKHLGFKIWNQGHNVHEFTTHDNTSYTLRPVYDNEEGRDYIGLRLSLRVSRSVEYRLTDVTELSDIPRLVEMMRLLAIPVTGKVAGRVQKHVA